MDSDSQEKRWIEGWQKQLNAYENMPKGTPDERILAAQQLHHIIAGTRGFVHGQDDMARKEGRERTGEYMEASKIADAAQTALNRLEGYRYEENKRANREFMERQKVEKAQRLEKLRAEKKAEEEARQAMIRKAQESNALIHGTMMGTHPHTGTPAAPKAQRKGLFGRVLRRWRG